MQGSLNQNPGYYESQGQPPPYQPPPQQPPPQQPYQQPPYQQPPYQQPAYGPPPQQYGPQKGQHSGMVTAGGILNIVGGVIALCIWFWMLSVWMWAADQADVEFTGFFGLGMVCLITPIIGAIFAIIGGIAALKRKSWGLALAGSIIGMIFGGGIFCLIALILIAIGKDEFQ